MSFFWSIHEFKSSVDTSSYPPLLTAFTSFILAVSIFCSLPSFAVPGPLLSAPGAAFWQPVAKTKIMANNVKALMNFFIM